MERVNGSPCRHEWQRVGPQVWSSGLPVALHRCRKCRQEIFVHVAQERPYQSFGDGVERQD